MPLIPDPYSDSSFVNVRLKEIDSAIKSNLESQGSVEANDYISVIDKGRDLILIATIGITIGGAIKKPSMAAIIAKSIGPSVIKLATSFEKAKLNQEYLDLKSQKEIFDKAKTGIEAKKLRALLDDEKGRSQKEIDGKKDTNTNSSSSGKRSSGTRNTSRTTQTQENENTVYTIEG